MRRSSLLLSFLALSSCGGPSAPPSAPPTVASVPTPTTPPSAPRPPPAASASASSAASASASAQLPPPAPLPAMTPADAAISAIVWTDDGKKQESLWLDGETEIARRDGVVLAAKGGLWAWKETTKSIPLKPACQSGATGTDEEASFVRLDKKQSVVVHGFGFLREFTGSTFFDSRATIDGSAGPFVFFHTSMSFAPCGERGVPSFSWQVFDLEKGKATALVTEADVPEDRKADAKSQCGCVSLESASVRYFGERPFEPLALYSNGSVYVWQMAAEVLPVLPPALAPYANVPAGVARWNASAKHAPVSGLSLVPDKSLLAAFRAK